MRIERDLYRLRMARRAHSNVFIVGCCVGTTCVSGNRLDHPFDVLKDTLDTPEASARDDRSFRWGIHRRLIDSRRWNGYGQLDRPSGKLPRKGQQTECAEHHPGDTWPK